MDFLALRMTNAEPVLHESDSSTQVPGGSYPENDEKILNASRKMAVMSQNKNTAGGELKIE